MIQDNKPTRETLEKWHKDPNNWKLGVFYYNKEDKRIFPPKRIAWTGWTVNFANPFSFLILVALLIILAFITYL